MTWICTEDWLAVACPRCDAPESEPCRNLSAARHGKFTFNSDAHPARRLLAMPATGRRCAVYRVFDAQDSLLYIGISYEPGCRMKEHRIWSPWFPDMDHYSTEWFTDRKKAREAEILAIQTEKPAWNIEDWLHEPATATPGRQS